jgi:exonuclease SbcC
MIKSIELKNIQSHANTKIEFSKGINCIVGSSNNGKTAILRGLYWVKYNRPLGIDSLASHWALNKKGDLNDSMSVTIENDFGKITRKRTKNENQYIVNDEILNVVKSDVPDSVERILKLSDTNIQKQLDEPFLLSSTSGEVAKYFNKVVRLDIIDKILTNAETTRRKTKTEIEKTEKQIQEREKELDGFVNLDGIETLINKFERVAKRNVNLINEIDSLKLQIEKYTEAESVISRNDFSDAKKIIIKIEKLSNDNFEIIKQKQHISYSLNAFENVKIYPDFSKQKKLIEKLLDYKPDTETIEKLKDDIRVYEIQKMHIENSDGDIRCLKEQLSQIKICPLCGKPMDVCKED